MRTRNHRPTPLEQPKERHKGRHLVWIEEEYRPPNTSSWCTLHVFWVLGSRSTSVEGESINSPYFRIRGGQKKFQTLERAKVFAVRQLKLDTKNQIRALQRILDSIAEVE